MALNRKPHHIFFAVTGRGEFPLDMLRRDEAEFATERDKAVAENYRNGLPETAPQRVVNIVMRNRDQYGCPTTKRWESFGWKVGQVYAIDAALSEQEQQLEIQWHRIARAWSSLPSGWDLMSTGNLTGEQRLVAVASNLEMIAIEARNLYEELRNTHDERAALLRQRNAVREFFGVDKN